MTQPSLDGRAVSSPPATLGQQMLAHEIALRHARLTDLETEMTAALSEEFKQTAVKQIPLGRVGKPEDVASAVCFLAAEEASYITGHVLNVNGGLLMG